MGIKLNFLVISESNQHISAGSEIKLAIISPLIIINVPFFPTQTSFSISCGLSGFTALENSKVTVIITDPSGLKVNEAEQLLNFPDFKRAASVIATFEVRNLILPSSGEYTFEARVNDVILGTQTFEAHIEEKNNG